MLSDDTAPARAAGLILWPVIPPSFKHTSSHSVLPLCATLCNMRARGHRMEQAKTVFVSMRLDPELVRGLDQIAETEGLTRSAVIERLCRRELQSFKMVGRLSALRQAIKSVDMMPIAALDDDPVVEWLLCGPVTFRKRRADLMVKEKAGGVR